MMKRILSLALAVALIVVLAVPVKAADIYDPWTEIADVCTVNDSGSNYFAFNNSTTVTLKPGFSTIVSQIDMIWFCGYGAPSSVYLWRAANSSSRVSLNIQHIGGSYYRIYGVVGNYTLSEYKFDIQTVSNSTTYRSYEIKSVRIAESVAVYNLDVSYSFMSEYDAPVSQYQSNVQVDPSIDVKYGTTQAYYLEVYTDQWKSYDYIDILVATSAASIGSINVTHNGRALPFEVSYLYTDSGSVAHSNDIYSSPLQPSCSVMIHIDLSSVTRTFSVPPVVAIEGWYNTGVGCGIQFSSCIGYIRPTDRTGVAFWFDKAKDFLSDLFDPDNPKADQFESEMHDQSQQMQDSVNQLDQLQKPNVDQISVDLSSVVSSSDFSYATAPLTVLLSNSLFSSMALITLTLALVAYVLFGKR